jgi:hypothetical protein
MQLDGLDLYLIGGTLLTTLVAMQWLGKLPKADSIQSLLAALNSRGGNILILSAFSVYFFHHSIKLFYMLLDMVRQQQLTQDNAFALMGLQFVTSTAFGGFSGALLKTMTGESSKARTTDGVDGTTTSTSTTTSTVNKSSTPPVIQADAQAPGAS